MPNKHQNTILYLELKGFTLYQLLVQKLRYVRYRILVINHFFIIS